jgi:hypothetical protein
MPRLGQLWLYSQTLVQAATDKCFSLLRTFVNDSRFKISLKIKSLSSLGSNTMLTGTTWCQFYKTFLSAIYEFSR